MKVSVIATVLNEEKTITSLVESLLTQTHQPDEIIIVDGGSTDNTLALLKRYEEIPFIKIIAKHTNIAEGRNIAIERAKHSIIAQIDGGCIAHKNWLKFLLKPLKNKEIGVSAGFYVMTTPNLLQKAVAPFLGITANNFDPRTFMPSGRSIAFRKSVWQQVGGYKEELQWAGEDTLFNYHLVKQGIEFARVPEALVYWEVPGSIPQVVKKFYMYAKGDAQAGIWWHPCKNLATHNIKIMLIFARYFSGFVLLFLSLFNLFFFYLLTLGFVFYVFWSLWKMKGEITNQVALMLVPFIQVLSDICVMTGFIAGFIMPTKSFKLSTQARIALHKN